MWKNTEKETGILEERVFLFQVVECTGKNCSLHMIDSLFYYAVNGS